jgi:hypothetical protein
LCKRPKLEEFSPSETREKKINLLQNFNLFIDKVIFVNLFKIIDFNRIRLNPNF